MKLITLIFLILNINFSANAAEQNANEPKQPALTTKPADKSQTSAGNDVGEADHKHEVLKTQFLGKRPYMEKVAK